jgi:hypothetical protein
MSTLLAEELESMGIEISFAPAYRSVSKGTVERVIETLRNFMRPLEIGAAE